MQLCSFLSHTHTDAFMHWSRKSARVGQENTKLAWTVKKQLSRCLMTSYAPWCSEKHQTAGDFTERRLFYGKIHTFFILFLKVCKCVWMQNSYIPCAPNLNAFIGFYFIFINNKFNWSSAQNWIWLIQSRSIAK